MGNLDTLKSFVQNDEELTDLHPCLQEGRASILQLVENLGIEVDEDTFFIDTKVQLDVFKKINAQIDSLEGDGLELSEAAKQFRINTKKVLFRNLHRRSELEDLSFDEYIETLAKVKKGGYETEGLKEHYAEMLIDICLKASGGHIDRAFESIFKDVFENGMNGLGYDEKKACKILFFRLLKATDVAHFANSSASLLHLFARIGSLGIAYEIIEDNRDKFGYRDETCFIQDAFAPFLEEVFEEYMVEMPAEDYLGELKGEEAILALMKLAIFGNNSLYSKFNEKIEEWMIQTLKKDKGILLGDDRGEEALDKLQELLSLKISESEPDVLIPDTRELKSLVSPFSFENAYKELDEWISEAMERDREAIIGNCEGVELINKMKQLVEKYPLLEKSTFYKSEMIRVFESLKLRDVVGDAQGIDGLFKFGDIHVDISECRNCAIELFQEYCDSVRIEDLIGDNFEYTSERIEALKKLLGKIREAQHYAHIGVDSLSERVRQEIKSIEEEKEIHEQLPKPLDAAF